MIEIAPHDRFRLSVRPHVHPRRSSAGTMRYGLVVVDLQHRPGMAAYDGRGSSRSGHPIGTASKGFCYNEIQRHLPCRCPQNSPRTEVGHRQSRFRRRAVQFGLHEPWAEAAPAHVRRLLRDSAPIPRGGTVAASAPSSLTALKQSLLFVDDRPNETRKVIEQHDFF